MALSVLIVMGSDSDLDQVTPAWQVLESLGVSYEVTVASAHRSPERVITLAKSARDRGFGVVLAAAGGAAHLAGVVAANTTLPVVAIPVAIGTLGGVDALLSAVQMPGGVPIASVGIGGARNAGFFAAAILSATDQALHARLEAFRQEQAKKVEEADARVQAKLGRAAPRS
ncbi:MAG TPA: 5-(carboxyamino)imidazole ribonucleotide mutase [Polyangiaceae bacterium]|jgi:5-(carboxyamino)imidazole ribonucleotide mutase|nr:5-(carboxyamino)imidazole ribonucleotide mutase [Polyangiaceae bacterium]